MGTSLIDIQRELGTDEQCLAYLEAARWPSGVGCLNCGSMKVGKTVSNVKARKGPKAGQVVKTRHLYDCLEKECGHQFSATTGTIFHDSHLPLNLWFHAVALVCNAKKSLSALQLQRDLGVGSYRTAWHLLHRIRKAMGPEAEAPFSGKVEADETHIGGRYDKRRKRDRYDTPVVFGVIQRKGAGRPSQVRAFRVPTTSAKILGAAVRNNVAPDARALYTDESRAYKRVGKLYRHATVNHIRLEYVRGDVHTNSIEGFWSLFKRGIRGQWHQISVKHLHRYLDEFSFRFNNREAEDLFGLTVSRMANAIALPYADLISE